MNYKIYDAGGDCAKKWYVYIIEKNSDGSTKQTKFYKGINTEPNKEARYKACNALIKKLCAGTVEVRNNTFAMEAELYLKRKQKEFKKRGLRNVTNSLDKFQLFLGDKKTLIANITKKEIMQYVQHMHNINNCARTINNNVSTLKTFFNDLITNREILHDNPCANLKSLRTIPMRHTAFNQEQVNEISVWCHHHNPKLLLYLKFVAYMAIRPAEIITIKIGDINFDRMEFYLDAGNTKNSKHLLKVIPSLMHQDMKGFNFFPGNYYLFGHAGEVSDRACGVNYFSKQFAICKAALGLPPHYTAYGMKHTVMRNLYENGLSPGEIMKVSGHTNMQSMEAYLRDIGAKKPVDISNIISVRL